MRGCNHFWTTHSHAKGLFCLNCGMDKPNDDYVLTGDYKTDVESLIRTIENLKTTDQVTALQAKVKELEGQVDQLKERVIGKTEQAVRCEAANQKLQAEVLGLRETVCSFNGRIRDAKKLKDWDEVNETVREFCDYAQQLRGGGE